MHELRALAEQVAAPTRIGSGRTAALALGDAIAIAVLVALGAGGAYFKKQQEKNKATEVRMEPVGRKDLVAAVRRSGIRVVFAEPQFNPRMAEVIAQEAGVKS